MEIPAIEEIVNHAMGQGGDPKMKAQATILIDQLRMAPDRWSVGLKLFFEGRSELSRFFGLSLVRDFLSSAFCPLSASYAAHAQSPILIYNSIRDAIWAWTVGNLSQRTPIPLFILNNLVTVLTLLIKLQFPESWPTAFSDLLEVGSGSTTGLDLAVRVICDLEVEVVMYSEGRGKAEIAHNVLIKDAMRANEDSIVRRLVDFLCQSAASVRGANVDLSERCLRCLAELIGWVDISLIACESTLSCMYLAIRDTELCSAVLACLLELVKKGMEPTQKIQMLHAIGLAQVLALVPIGGAKGSKPKDDDDDDDGAEEELGLVVDVYLMELLGCWSKYEDSLFLAAPASGGSSDTTSSSNELQQLKELAPTIASLLKSLLPIALAVLNHRDLECTAAASVVPSLGRLITMLKQQAIHKSQIDALTNGEGLKSDFFLASDYLHPLLLGIYQQLQYDEDFGFVVSSDEDSAIIEAKKEVRKLFVNCCRVHPEPCLQLISIALTSLPQPLSAAPFAPLEAALRLIYSFSECGPQFSALVNEGTFPALIIAIHQTDIASHPHPQVVLAYFEICVRYIRHADTVTTRRFVAAMVDHRGLRHPISHVRCRTAYFLFKTAEALEGKASTLLSVVGSLADVILPTPALLADLNSGSTSKVMLSESAELHLLEAIGLITSSTYCYFEGDVAGEIDNNCSASILKQQQKQVEVQLQMRQRQQTLEEVIRLISGHIHSLLSFPQLNKFTEEVGAVVAHKVSCLSSLAKGHSYKSRAKHPDTTFDAATSFDAAASAAVAAATTLGHIAAVRGKCVIFHHRMIMCAGLRSLEALSHSVPLLLSYCDNRAVDSGKEGSGVNSTEGSSDEVLQLLNQAMLEFQGAALITVDACLTPALKKCWSLSAEVEKNAYVPALCDGQHPSVVNRTGSSDAPKAEVEAPHFQAERIALQKQSLVFLQHISTQQCDQALYSDRNSSLLTAIFVDEILVGLQGGRGRISAAGGIPLRKAATGTLTGLVKAWLSTPSAHPIPNTLSAALWSFLKEKALPTILRSCTDGVSLDLRDAAAQAYLVDVGTFLWTLSSPTCQEEQHRLYLTDALPALGWSQNAASVLLNMLAAQTPLGTFKENFKKFIRSAAVA